VCVHSYVAARPTRSEGRGEGIKEGEKGWEREWKGMSFFSLVGKYLSIYPVTPYEEYLPCRYVCKRKGTLLPM
jgi:hypothetical protein